MWDGLVQLGIAQARQFSKHLLMAAPVIVVVPPGRAGRGIGGLPLARDGRRTEPPLCLCYRFSF